MAYLDAPKRPGPLSLMIGVIFPAAVILLELCTGLCAETFFDPLPTAGHLVAVGSVPAINLLLLLAAQRDVPAKRWLLWAGGAAAAIAACYTLLLLPILPFALIGILVGIGILPFAPLLSLICTIRWMAAIDWDGRPIARGAGGGALVGLLALVIVDLPATATYVALNRYAGDDRAQAGGIRLMRWAGDRDVLLRLAYGDSARATGLISYAVSRDGAGWDDRSQAARELYYRTTGTAFNAVAMPAAARSGRRRWTFDWDGDQGGESVGRRVDTLSLASSRIDGSVAAADSLGYFEWTVEIANAAPMAHEARFTLALPEGAVASRATLWVNGEPREASVAGRGAARAAYSSVVRAQRDPLLVTTDGAQRLLVQAFPILPNSRMKLRIGYTAPFVIAPDGRRTMALPAIVERNFAIDRDLRHQLWIDGDGAMSSDGARLHVAGSTLRGAIGDADLLGHPPTIAAQRLTAPSIRTGAVPASGTVAPLAIRQTIAPAWIARPSALMIVLDGSANNAGAGAALANALDAIPAGVPVGLAIAAGTPVRIGPAPWSPAQRARVAAAIADTAFVGGQDDLPALTAALAAAPGGDGAILWIHGPQPIDFARSRPPLEQILERAAALPRLIRYQAEPGRAATLDNRWFETTRIVTPSGDATRDLRALLGDVAGGGVRWRIDRVATPATGTPGSAHIVRLWAAERIAALGPATGKPRDDAIALAHRLNLVTPVSGAVVLETDRDYRANGLPVPGADEVPTVPEPGEWALIAIVTGAGLWLLRRRRAASGGMALA